MSVPEPWTLPDLRSSRRTFLARLSAAAALAALPTRSRQWPWQLTPDDLLPDLGEATLRELARVAIEAARAAGADFTDVRLAAGHTIGLIAVFDRRRKMTVPKMGEPGISMTSGYGVRVIVDGAWGFAAGQEVSREAVAEVAHRAVARARANRPRQPRTLELAPVPTGASGQWVTPIAHDPFAVPVLEQVERQLAILAAAAGVPGLVAAAFGSSWERGLRVFASSDGTLQVQRTAYAEVRAPVQAQAGPSYPLVPQNIQGLLVGPYGYEAAAPTVDLRSAAREAVERAIALSKQWRDPQVPAEAGRFDLVLSASAMRELLVYALIPALNAERALGYRANQEGTSFAAPPGDILGKYQVGSPALTVRADRTRPGGHATIKWDDEGVPTEAFPLIQEGVIVDYLTDRQCAAELASSYKAQGAEVRSHGCASGTGDQQPRVYLPNLTLEPGREALAEEDLIRDTKRGFYVNSLSGDSDQQVINSQFSAGFPRVIRNGRLGEPVRDAAIQFLTTPFWKSLDALGGAATAESGRIANGVSSNPYQLSYASVSTVPGRFRQVNVLNTGRTA